MKSVKDFYPTISRTKNPKHNSTRSIFDRALSSQVQSLNISETSESSYKNPKQNSNQSIFHRALSSQVQSLNHSEETETECKIYVVSVILSPFLKFYCGFIYFYPNRKQKWKV